MTVRVPAPSRATGSYRAAMATIDKQKVRQLVDRARREVDEGLLPSCQVALGFEGELVTFETFGDATPDTRYCLYSATKAIVASGVWTLIDDGLLDVSRPVADYLPAVAANGKEQVTVEQVMLHTSGFPNAPLGPGRWSTSGPGRAARWGTRTCGA